MQAEDGGSSLGLETGLVVAPGVGRCRVAGRVGRRSDVGHDAADEGLAGAIRRLLVARREAMARRTVAESAWVAACEANVPVFWDEYAAADGRVAAVERMLRGLVIGRSGGRAVRIDDTIVVVSDPDGDLAEARLVVVEVGSIVAL